jgi:hypothetical protein
LDEACLALALAERGWSTLHLPLGYDQMAPLGFLALAKAVVGGFGDGEMALRLSPLLFGLAAPAMLWRAARRLFGAATAALAAALLALWPAAVFHSGEFKQYAADLAAAALVLLLFALGPCGAARREPGRPLAAAGAVLVWCSHAAAFALAGAGLAAGWNALRARDWRALANTAAVAALWLLSFAAHLWLAGALTSGVAQNMRDLYWAEAFPPLPPRGLAEAWRAFSVATALSAAPEAGGLHLLALAALLGLLAAAGRGVAVLLLLAVPPVAAYLAAGLRLYPFAVRFLLFALAPLAVLAAAGVAEALPGLLRPQLRRRAGPALVAAVAAALLLVNPLRAGLREAAAPVPYAREEMRPVLREVARRAAPGDTVYVHWGALPAFRWYAPRLGLGAGTAVVEGAPPVPSGLDPAGSWDRYLDDLAALRGRVWLVFSAVQVRAVALDTGLDSERLSLLLAERRGARRLDLVTATGARAHLYLFD